MDNYLYSRILKAIQRVAEQDPEAAKRWQQMSPEDQEAAATETYNQFQQMLGQGREEEEATAKNLEQVKKEELEEKAPDPKQFRTWGPSQDIGKEYEYIELSGDIQAQAAADSEELEKTLDFILEQIYKWVARKAIALRGWRLKSAIMRAPEEKRNILIKQYRTLIKDPKVDAAAHSLFAATGLKTVDMGNIKLVHREFRSLRNLRLDVALSIVMDDKFRESFIRELPEEESKKAREFFAANLEKMKGGLKGVLLGLKTQAERLARQSKVGFTGLVPITVASGKQLKQKVEAIRSLAKSFGVNINNLIKKRLVQPGEVAKTLRTLNSYISTLDQLLGLATDMEAVQEAISELEAVKISLMQRHAATEVMEEVPELGADIKSIETQLQDMGNQLGEVFDELPILKELPKLGDEILALSEMEPEVESLASGALEFMGGLIASARAIEPEVTRLMQAPPAEQPEAQPASERELVEANKSSSISKRAAEGDSPNLNDFLESIEQMADPGQTVGPRTMKRPHVTREELEKLKKRRQMVTEKEKFKLDQEIARYERQLADAEAKGETQTPKERKQQRMEQDVAAKNLLLAALGEDFGDRLRTAQLRRTEAIRIVEKIDHDVNKVLGLELPEHATEETYSPSERERRPEMMTLGEAETKAFKDVIEALKKASDIAAKIAGNILQSEGDRAKKSLIRVNKVYSWLMTVSPDTFTTFLTKRSYGKYLRSSWPSIVRGVSKLLGASWKEYEDGIKTTEQGLKMLGSKVSQQIDTIHAKGYPARKDFPGAETTHGGGEPAIKQEVQKMFEGEHERAVGEAEKGKPWVEAPGEPGGTNVPKPGIMGGSGLKGATTRTAEDMAVDEQQALAASEQFKGAVDSIVAITESDEFKLMEQVMDAMGSENWMEGIGLTEEPYKKPAPAPKAEERELVEASAEETGMERKAGEWDRFDVSKNKLEIIEGEDGKKRLVVNQNLRNLVTKRITDIIKGAHKEGDRVQIDFGDHLGYGLVQSYLGSGKYHIAAEGLGVIEAPADVLYRANETPWR